MPIKKPAAFQKIASQRIEELFRVAKKLSKIDSRYGDICVKHALKLSQKNRVPIPNDLKMQFCKTCKTYFKMGENVRIRLNSGKLVYYCTNCSNFARISYKK